MIKIKEEIFVWLSIIDGLTYLIYLKLIEIFGSTINLYNYSKDKNKFEEYLISNGFILNENLKSKITNKELKFKANKIYNYLNSKNIKIIPITSKYYIKSLRNIFSPPLCIYVVGNINLLNRKKIYVYENKNMSGCAKKIVNFLYARVFNVNKYLVLNRNLYIKSINLLDNFLDFDTNNKIYIYYNVNMENNIIEKLEIISGIIDLIIIPESDYNKDISIIVDTILEIGKDICVFPNDIYNKNAYFSNYLIKNGANVLTNIYEVEKILDNL